MTSHKEQPAVDTSAEKLLVLAGDCNARALVTADRADAELFAKLNETLRFLAAQPAEPPSWWAEELNRRASVEGVLRKAAKAGKSLTPEDCRTLATTLSIPKEYQPIAAPADMEALVRSLPAEPEGLELETTAEERERWAGSYGPIGTLARDFDRMRARAEKAEAENYRLQRLEEARSKQPDWEKLWAEQSTRAEEAASELAALKQPVSDEEVEKLARRFDPNPDDPSGYVLGNVSTRHVANIIRRLVRERDALSSQLRDAQARGKGMEEALAKIASHPEQDQKVKKGRVTESYGIGWAFHNIQSIARAALSRPEGSAST